MPLAFVNGSVGQLRPDVKPAVSVQCCEKPSAVASEWSRVPSRREFGAWVLSIACATPLPALANKGGKDRCDAAFDVSCGTDGQKLGALTVYDVPQIDAYKVTDKVYMGKYQGVRSGKKRFESGMSIPKLRANSDSFCSSGSSVSAQHHEPMFVDRFYCSR